MGRDPPIWDVNRLSDELWNCGSRGVEGSFPLPQSLFCTFLWGLSSGQGTPSIQTNTHFLLISLYNM